MSTIAGMQRVLECAYAALGNPIVMIDTSYNLLAHTQNRVGDDPLWNELLELGAFSSETVDFFYKTKFVQAYADSDVVSLMQSDQIPYDRACGKLFDQNGIQVGSIVVVACQRPFAAGDFEQIAAICGELEAENNACDVPPLVEQVFPEHTWLTDFLEEGTQPPPLPPFRAQLKQYLFVCVVDTSRYDPTKTHLAYFRDRFAQLQPEHRYAIHLDNIVILVSGENRALHPKRNLAALTDFFQRHNMDAGFSSCFENLYDLRKYYQQALSDLNRKL